MNLRKHFLLLCILAVGATLSAADVDYTRFVNPRIGTGGHGHVFLGANVPFGKRLPSKNFWTHR